MPQIISKTTSYAPYEWGIRDKAGEIEAFVKYRATNRDYSFYGVDADVYEEFEMEGFERVQKFSAYVEAQKWLNRTVYGERHNA